MSGVEIEQLRQKVKTLEAENQMLRSQPATQTTIGEGEQYGLAAFESVEGLAIVATDLAHRVTQHNAGALRLLGQNLLGRSFESVLAEAGTDIECFKVSASTVRLAQADGAVFWVTGKTTPVHSVTGELTGFVTVLQDRSEAHSVRMRLEEGDARYRTLVDSIDVGFCIIEMKFDEAGRSCDYRFVEVNPAFERHTGLQNATGRWVSQLAPDLEQHWLDIYGEVARSGTPARFENDAATLNRWYEVYAVRVGDPALFQVAVLFNDLSTRRAAELARQQSEAHWRGLFETLQEGFVLAELIRDEAGRGVDWRYIDVNAAWSEILDIPLDGVIGRTVRELFPATEQEWIDQIAQVVHTGEADSFTRQVGTSGRWYDGRVHYLEGERFAITFQDATPRRRDDIRRRALLDLIDGLHDIQDVDDMAYAAAELLGRTLSVNRAGYCTLSRRGRVVTVRRDWALPNIAPLAGPHSLRALGGFAEALIRGQCVVIEDAMSDSRTASHAAEMEALAVRSLLQVPVIELGRTVAAFFVCRPTATRWAEDELAFVVEVASRVRAAIERRRAEQKLHALNASLEREIRLRTEELLKSEEKLRQSQKMEAVGQLTGGIAHDFNNLLTGISGSLELLQTRIAQGRVNDLDRYIAAAQGASTRAASLTHRLLAFSRQQTLDPRPTDVNCLVRDIEDLIRRTVGPAVIIQTQPATELWQTLVDQNQLENVLLNLCINSRDAMPGGGRLTIETANLWMDSRTAAEIELPAGHYVSLSVTDTGTGMPPEVAAKAFEPFFTTKPLGMGTGLGLSMIYGFARQSGGQVRIHSQVGRGTTIVLYLPRYIGEDENVCAQQPHAPARAEVGETVLVVDDEPTVRMLVTDLLDDLGYQTIEASEAESGLRILDSATRVDLLISDVGLPGGVDGREFANRARALRPGLKVLFITGYVGGEVEKHFEPDMHIMTKPFGVDALSARIRALLAG
jgi:signal transduction histidine kinase/PAS domain-containing protein/CheY-like chemotaxis protein